MQVAYQRSPVPSFPSLPLFPPTYMLSVPEPQSAGPILTVILCAPHTQGSIAFVISSVFCSPGSWRPQGLPFERTSSMGSCCCRHFSPSSPILYSPHSLSLVVHRTAAIFRPGPFKIDTTAVRTTSQCFAWVAFLSGTGHHTILLWNLACAKLNMVRAGGSRMLLQVAPPIKSSNCTRRRPSVSYVRGF
jgi:hypothetical protein